MPANLRYALGIHVRCTWRLHGQTELPDKPLSPQTVRSIGQFDRSDKTLLQVVIETPKGSRNKFAFNADEHVFELKKVLPAGMSFPYDFGSATNRSDPRGRRGSA